MLQNEHFMLALFLGFFFIDDTNIFRIEYDLNTLWSQVGLSRNVNEEKTQNNIKYLIILMDLLVAQRFFMIMWNTDFL